MLLDPATILHLETDGGATPPTKSYLCFSIATNNGRVLWIAGGHCFGFKPTSFRGKATAMTAAFILPNLLFKYYNDTYTLPDSFYEYSLDSQPAPPPTLSAQFHVHCNIRVF